LCQWIPREGAIPHEMRIPECRRLRCRTRIDRVDPSGPAMLAGAGGLSERTRVRCSDRLIPKLPTLLRYRYARRFPEVPGLYQGWSEEPLETPIIHRPTHQRSPRYAGQNRDRLSA